MHVAVYLLLLLPLLAAVSARWITDRLPPRAATWLLTTSALALAAASGIALTALAATAIGQIPLVAELGHWSVRALRRDDPASLSIALIACVALAAALIAAGRGAISRVRALITAARTARCLPASEAVTVLDDPEPDAYALPGRPGRIVVSTGMLKALDDREQDVLLAHERAHVRCGHHFFVAATHIAAATNPLLRPLDRAVRYAVERWADEHAAAEVGDRRLVATTIGKAALLAPSRQPIPGALAISGAALRRSGPIPRRVAALFAAPPRRGRVLLAVTFAVLAVAAAASVETARDLHILFELAQAGRP
ncbi:M56 family metallopeptidase [Saccharopolyspora sp. NPDC002686]|uniref:M56 family metallopeptidase n=1 Tax=Saccharopolyspora sp. NPDC002686 TaxID=3154541 RepID=UPI0033213F76